MPKATTDVFSYSYSIFYIYFLISELDIFGGLDHRKDKATKIESQIVTFLVVFIFL
jgi:hypothetical protein